MSEVTVRELNVYPVKACQGVPTDEIEISPQGIVGDRVFVLWEDGKLVDQVETPQIGSLGVHWNAEAGTLGFTHAEMGEYVHEVRDAGESRPTEWVLDKFQTRDQGDEAAAWLSSALGKPVRLVDAAEPWQKNIPLDSFKAVHGLSVNQFYSATPVSLSNTASLGELNTRVETPVPMDRFRMNIIVDGLDPWAEDDIVSISSDTVSLSRVDHCERCIITTTDQKTGQRTKSDLLKVLAQYRHRDEGKFGSGLLFGTYMAVSRPGTLKVGDRLQVEYADGRA